MDKIDFYKWINQKINKRLHSNGKNNILILYDFENDFFDVKNEKIRIGIKKIDSKKIQKIQHLIDSHHGAKFDAIDMRMTLRTIKINLDILFKFFYKNLKDDGYVFGFMNNDFIFKNKYFTVKQKLLLNDFLEEYKKDHKIIFDNADDESIVFFIKN